MSELSVFTRTMNAFAWKKTQVVHPPQSEVPDGFFVLIDSLCDRAGIQRGSFVDAYGMSEAISARKPKPWQRWRPGQQLVPAPPKKTKRRSNRCSKGELNKQISDEKRAA